MTDKEWLTVSEASQRLNVPAETLRRYIRGHNVHIRVKKVSKKYYIHEESMNVIQEIRSLYDSGKSIEEVEESLSNKGVPMTITIHDDHDRPMNVNVIDEMKQFFEKKFTEQHLYFEQLFEQQHLHFEKKIEEIRHDHKIVSQLRDSMEKRKLESAIHEDKANELLENIEKQLVEIKQEQEKDSEISEISEQLIELKKMIEETKQAQIQSAASKEKRGFFSRLFKGD